MSTLSKGKSTLIGLSVTLALVCSSTLGQEVSPGAKLGQEVKPAAKYGDMSVVSQDQLNRAASDGNKLSPHEWRLPAASLLSKPADQHV
jgi:hypothetical protein